MRYSPGYARWTKLSHDKTEAHEQTPTFWGRENVGMEVYFQRILDISTRRRWVVNFKLLTIYHAELFTVNLWIKVKIVQ